MDPRLVAGERHRLGLDAPLLTHCSNWIRRLARLDLGESVRYPGRSVSSLIAERSRYSALVGCAALIVATFLGIPIGVLTGTSRRGPFLLAIRAGVLLLLSLPRSFCRRLCSSSRHEQDGFLSAVYLRIQPSWKPLVIWCYPSCAGAPCRRCWNEFRLGLFSTCSPPRRCWQRAREAFRGDGLCGGMRSGCR